ncbi:MAG TPA: hypothetical protein VGU90_03970 [Terriglobales bacterium]|nr:hypothetical protein [Terriglobales bacterium]
MKYTAIVLAALLLTQPVVAEYLHEGEMPHVHAEATMPEAQPTLVFPSISGNQISTIAHFNCPACGGQLDIIIPGMFREKEVRKRLQREETWCDAGRRCDWHGTLAAGFALRLSFGQWIRSL